MPGLRGGGDSAVDPEWIQPSSGSGVDEGEANASVGRTADRREAFYRLSVFGTGMSIV